MLSASANCLTVIGDLVEDVVVWLRGPVDEGTDNAADVHRSCGGSAANVALAAAAEGTPTRFVGRVGVDVAGDMLAAELERRGIDVRVQRGGRTGTVVVLVAPSAERTMFPDRGAAAELDRIPEEWLVGTAVTHVPAYGFQTEVTARAIRGAVEEVRRAGGAVTLDVSATSLIDQYGAAAFRDLVADLRPEILFANAEEADRLGLGLGAPGPGTVYVIKDGPRPATVIGSEGVVARVAAAEVADVRDTTGAGDAFAGGFLSAWMKGRTFEESCAAGHRSAARILAVPGGGSDARPINLTEMSRGDA